MLNLFSRTAHALLILLMVLPAAAVDEVERKNAELKALDKALGQARSEVERLSGQHARELEALRAMEIKQAHTAKALHEAREEAFWKRTEVEELRRKGRKLEEAIARGQASLAESIKMLYMLGGKGALDGLLSPGSHAERMRMEVYLATVREEYQRKLAGLRSDIAENQRVEAELQASLAHLTELEAAAEREQRQLVELRRKQAEAVEALSARMKRGEARVEQIRQEQKALAALVKRLEAAARKPEPSSPAKPVASPPAPSGKPGAIPVSGRLVRGYGQSTGLGELRSYGHFYATEPGAEVRAAADGQVVFADWMRGFGQLLIIQHSGGYLSLYAHNEAIYKSVGAKVRRGDVIAVAGRSGGARDTGLYFEVRKGGKPINPSLWSAMRGS